MKKIVSPLLAILLLLGAVSIAEAANCTEQDSVTDPCVKVCVGVMPRCVDPGETITVYGCVKNGMPCYDIFTIKVDLDYWPFDTPTDVDAKRKWMRPKVIIPLQAGNSFKFSYEATIPKMVPLGKYTITLSAWGKFSRCYGEDSATFYVGPCPSVP